MRLLLTGEGVWDVLFFENGLLGVGWSLTGERLLLRCQRCALFGGLHWGIEQGKHPWLSVDMAVLGICLNTCVFSEDFFLTWDE